MKKLIPLDKKRCQAEKKIGDSFMSLGGLMGRIRCKNKPNVIITEKTYREGYKKRGSMSLCDECLIVAKKQLGDTFTTRKLNEKTKI